MRRVLCAVLVLGVLAGGVGAFSAGAALGHPSELQKRHGDTARIISLTPSLAVRLLASELRCCTVSGHALRYLKYLLLLVAFSIYLQMLASIQPRTSLVKVDRSP